MEGEKMKEREKIEEREGDGGYHGRRIYNDGSGWWDGNSHDSEGLGYGESGRKRG